MFIIEYHLLQPASGRQTVRPVADPYAGQGPTDTDRFINHCVGGKCAVPIEQGVYGVVDVSHRVSCRGVGQTRAAIAQRPPRCRHEPIRVHDNHIASGPDADRHPRPRRYGARHTERVVTRIVPRA
ncbi:hypothetical protein [Micromonospora zhanjiangensis]|uniref:Uncharacterized protein n=1 Tax=Micromonospora zhanjiangensis TaxID=1522057 RepID=A0ABV8KYR3_9ACTN